MKNDQNILEKQSITLDESRVMLTHSTSYWDFLDKLGLNQNQRGNDE